MPTDAQLRLEGAYKVLEWMEVLNREAGATYDIDRLRCDLDHSALIYWLCKGNAALPECPPVRFSRPAHQEAVNGSFHPTSVVPWKDVLIVDQEAWKLLETKGTTDWVAAYKTAADSSTWSAPWSVRAEGQGWIAERLPRPQ